MTAQVRSAFTLALGTMLALLLPSSAEPTGALVAVAVLVLVVAALALPRGTSQLRWRLPLQARDADENRCLRTEHATDPVHSPLRPRAPGLG